MMDPSLVAAAAVTKETWAVVAAPAKIAASPKAAATAETVAWVKAAPPAEAQPHIAATKEAEHLRPVEQAREPKPPPNTIATASRSAS